MFRADGGPQKSVSDPRKTVLVQVALNLPSRGAHRDEFRAHVAKTPHQYETALSCERVVDLARIDGDHIVASVDSNEYAGGQLDILRASRGGGFHGSIAFYRRCWTEESRINLVVPREEDSACLVAGKVPIPIFEYRMTNHPQHRKLDNIASMSSAQPSALHPA